MNILLLDTSTSNFHLTIKVDDRFATFTSKTPFDHTEHILLIIDACLNTLHTKINSINYALVGTGPGSFNGIRISHSVIKGLFFESNTKIIPIPSLSLLSYSFFFELNLFNNLFEKIKDLNLSKEKDESFPIYSMIFGKKNRYYFAKYYFSKNYENEKDEKRFVNQFINPDIEDLPFDKIKDIVLIDKEENKIFLLDDILNCPDYEKEKFVFFEPKINGTKIINFFEKNLDIFTNFSITADKLLPLYIRKSDAEENIEK
ncbi:MAG TPA: tRNA (adenosine(37)-N6)-threonylcarbamoyltransferase complex dimerization subunit type 1 TsaB [Exilispira sp.]|nr:tRNA (adenosine(37)-N6)-threonylcarbamoyltransferase complex dimerization subunit type 1 TsaB [Exilispira sp.]